MLVHRPGNVPSLACPSRGFLKTNKQTGTSVYRVLKIILGLSGDETWQVVGLTCIELSPALTQWHIPIATITGDCAEVSRGQEPFPCQGRLSVRGLPKDPPNVLHCHAWHDQPGPVPR